MNPTLTDLWRAALDSGAARWMEGMLVDGHRIVAVKEHGVWWVDEDATLESTVLWAGFDWLKSNGYVPDFDDSGTKGCLLQQVREAWKAPSAHAYAMMISEADPKIVNWDVDVRVDEFGGKTEAEALMAALVAAPEAA